MSERKYYFFLGTIAEFIKVMPVMRELSDRGVPFKIIASGQNALSDNELFASSGIRNVDITINERPIKKSAAGLFVWFFETLFKALAVLRNEFDRPRDRTTLIVHGDTVSTVMGAFLGKCFGLRVAHVEAGLRSFNFLQPFPEEIDRYLTSFFADINFCPYDAAVHNLRRRHGAKIDTRFNTNLDSLAFALSKDAYPESLKGLRGQPYFIFIMHRQENLLNKPLVREIVRGVLQEAKSMTCVLIMHDLTRSTLAELGLLESIENDPHVVVAGRLPYLDFIGLLNESEFIITDGGGNQQETYYLGKPCLILRHVTEGNEGIGANVLLSRNDIGVIREFMANYKSYESPMIEPDIRPSHIIADVLIGP